MFDIFPVLKYHFMYLKELIVLLTRSALRREGSMMKDLERELEAERQRMNELGRNLLAQSHSLAEHREMQELSQRVDQLVIRYHQVKRTQKRQER